MTDPQNLHKILLLKIFTSVARRESAIVPPLFVRVNPRPVTRGRMIAEARGRVNRSRKNGFSWTGFMREETCSVLYLHNLCNLLPAVCHNHRDHG